MCVCAKCLVIQHNNLSFWFTITLILKPSMRITIDIFRESSRKVSAHFRYFSWSYI